jgi:Tol biopolymer transport system component
MGGLALSLLIQATPQAAGGPGLVRIQASAERAEPGATAGPLEGIRTYGTVPFTFPVPAEAVPANGTGSGVAAATAAGAVRKISGVPMAGRVTAFALDPTGATAVYIADQEVVGRYELYRAQVAGLAAPTKLSAGLPLETGDAGVRSFQITPDGTKVVFLADAFHGAGNDDIFSVPIDGSTAAVRLNVGTESPVTAFGIAPNSTTALFFAVDATYASGRAELFAATIGTAASRRQLSDVGTGVVGGAVVFAVASPNSARVVYASDSVVDGRFQLSSVPANAAAPGQDVVLSAALGSVGRLAINPASTIVAYTADENTLGVYDVYSTPIAGGARTRLTPAMVGSGARSVEFSPDGARVGYLADQNTVDVVEVYRAQPGVAASGTRLNTPMAGTQRADTLNFSPDGGVVLYEADQNAAGTFELYAVPANGGAVTTLHALVPPADAAFFADRGTPIVGSRAVYPVLGAQAELFSVPWNGSGPFVRLNDALAAGVGVRDAFIPATPRRLVAFGIGGSAGSVTSSLFAVPVRRDLGPELVNVPAGGAAVGVLAYAISGAEGYIVYVQDQDTTGKPELFSRELDTDGDTVINAQDSCPYSSNPTQARVILGKTILAPSKTALVWSGSLDVRWVRGPLGAVASYATDASGVLAEASSLTDAAVPAASAGFYYLVAPDCPGRSFQSTLGAEPGRDAAAFP